MAWSPTVYSLPPLVAAVLSVAVAVPAWRNRREPMARAFLALMGALAAWSITYAVQLGFDGVGAQLLFQRIGLAFGVTIPGIWLVLTLYYSGRGEAVTPLGLAALAVDPAAMVLLLATNHAHGLLWSNPRLPPGMPAVDVTFGVPYLAHFAYAYVLVTAGIVLVLDVAVSSPVRRRQALLLAVGAIVPLGVNVTFTLGASPVPGLDLTTFAFSVTGVTFGLALYRFDLLSVGPVGHRRAVEAAGDGVLVLGPEGRVRDHSGVVDRAFDPPPTPGDQFGPSLPDGVDGVDDLDGEVLVDDSRRPPRRYDVAVTEVTDRRDRSVGRLVSLRDVTDRREYARRLEVANRLLRHNVRNELTVLKGYGQRLAGDLDGDDAAAARRIVEAARTLDEMSEKARRMVDTATGDRTVTVDLVAAVESAVAEADREYDADVAVTRAPETAPVAAPDSDAVEAAVYNLVENGVVHDDGDRPRVRVGVETGVDAGTGNADAEAAADGAVPGDDGEAGRADDDEAAGVDDGDGAGPRRSGWSPDGDGRDPVVVGGPVPRAGWTTVEVRDEGPGVPAVEREVLRRGAETDLRHGSGIGLWLVRTVVRAAGGELSLRDRGDGDGTVATLRWRPAAAEPSGTGGVAGADREAADGVGAAGTDGDGAVRADRIDPGAAERRGEGDP